MVLLTSKYCKRVAVVTGSNQGLGLEVVRQLSSTFDGDIILTTRRYTAGLEALKRSNLVEKRVKVHQLDLTDDASIKNLVEFIKHAYGGVDILVNNAAIFLTESNASIAPDDVRYGQVIREIMDVNYFKTAHFTDAMFPLLRPGARVVNVASTWGLLYVMPNNELKLKLKSSNLTRSELDALVNQFIIDASKHQHREKGWIDVATPDSFDKILDHTYRMSKVFLIALTNIQKRDWSSDSRGLIVNAVHPGFVATYMTTFKGRETMEEGARSLVYAATQVPPTIPAGKVICYPDLKLIDWEPSEKDKQRVDDEREFYIKACQCQVNF